MAEQTQIQPWYGTPVDRPLKLAVLVSGGGRTLVNLLQKCDQGEVNATVVHAIASNAKAQEATANKVNALPVDRVDRKQFDSTEAFSQAIFERCRKANADVVCLAGFLCLLHIPEDFQWRVLNIHPALLPAFGGRGMYGHHVHEAVLERGCKVSGCTVHFANNEYDAGPILVQRTCSVLYDDTAERLADRVFQHECQAYPEAISLLAEGRVEIIDHRRTRIHPLHT